MNPDGYAGPHLNQFLDAGPWLEDCDRMNCTAPVGGDHVPTCAAYRTEVYVTYGPCHWCKSDTDSSSVNVSLPDGRVVVFCAACYEKGDEGPDIPLDMTEDELDREGQPEFNGAFNAW